MESEVPLHLLHPSPQLNELVGDAICMTRSGLKGTALAVNTLLRQYIKPLDWTTRVCNNAFGTFYIYFDIPRSLELWLIQKELMRVAKLRQRERFIKLVLSLARCGFAPHEANWIAWGNLIQMYAITVFTQCSTHERVLWQAFHSVSCACTNHTCDMNPRCTLYHDETLSRNIPANSTCELFTSLLKVAYLQNMPTMNFTSASLPFLSPEFEKTLHDLRAARAHQLNNDIIDTQFSISLASAHSDNTKCQWIDGKMFSSLQNVIRAAPHDDTVGIINSIPTTYRLHHTAKMYLLLEATRRGDRSIAEKVLEMMSNLATPNVSLTVRDTIIHMVCLLQDELMPVYWEPDGRKGPLDMLRLIVDTVDNFVCPRISNDEPLYDDVNEFVDYCETKHAGIVNQQWL